MREESSFATWVRNLNAEEKDRLIRKIEQDATAIEVEYYGCARCVLRALQQNLNLGGSEAFKASLPLSGGVARNCEVCGALLGGLMVVGLAYGSDKLAFPFGAYVKGKEQDDEVAQRYSEVMRRSGIICDRFKETFGGLRCVEVQKAIRGKFWDLRDPQQLEEYLQPIIHDKCGSVAGAAARITAETILESTDS